MKKIKEDLNKLRNTVFTDWKTEHSKDVSFFKIHLQLMQLLLKL